MASAPWNADTLLGARLGSCELQRTLGVGGMGAVYLARQERPRRQVAVKVLRPLREADPAAQAVFLARFQREADATAALDHTHIVPIYEFGEQDGIAYLVMPYLPDGSLAALLAREGRLPLDQVVDYVSQAAAALDYAHTRGILHRDVKPSNLLLHPDGRLLLADFGIARPLDAPPDPDRTLTRATRPVPEAAGGGAGLTMAGALLGTPQYMAPEQITGEHAGRATDVYALGVLTYTLLAGKPPFEAPTMGETLRRKITTRPASLRGLLPDLPPGVADTISWAMERRLEDRPQSAGAFARALEMASGGESWDAVAGVGEHVGLGSGRLALAATSDTPTLYDPGTGPGGARSAAPPVWPSAVHAHGAGSYRARPLERMGTMPWPALLAAVAAVVLIGALALSGFAAALPGMVALFSGQGALVPVVHTTPTPTPSPTPLPTPTATPVINWLSASSTSLELGCSKRTKSATVTLRNYGPEETGWSAGYNWFGGGISVSPAWGTLSSQGVVTITVTNTSLALFGAQHGTITIKPADPNAGASVVIDYATQGC